jgi:ribosomal protein S24E
LLESLLILFCGKNSSKKKKVKQLLNTIWYDEKTKEFHCKSFSRPDTEYIVIYSHGSKEWVCNCPAKIYQEYKTFESAEDKYRLKRKMECIHIIASRAYQALHL